MERTVGEVELTLRDVDADWTGVDVVLTDVTALLTDVDVDLIDVDLLDVVVVDVVLIDVVAPSAVSTRPTIMNVGNFIIALPCTASSGCVRSNLDIHILPTTSVQPNDVYIYTRVGWHVVPASAVSPNYVERSALADLASHENVLFGNRTNLAAGLRAYVRSNLSKLGET